MRASFLSSRSSRLSSTGSSRANGGVTPVDRLWKGVGPGALLALMALAPSLGGCGGVLYAVQASAANSKVEEARSLRAETQAPYEFYLAEEHMKKASEEASQANYGDAVELAERAEEAADKAIKLTRDALKGKGR
jgi:hypothetical protein